MRASGNGRRRPAQTVDMERWQEQVRRGFDVAAELKADVVSPTEALPPSGTPSWTVRSSGGGSAPRPQGRLSGAAITVLSSAMWSRIGAVRLSQYIIALATSFSCGTAAASEAVYAPPAASAETLQRIYDEADSWNIVHPTEFLCIGGDVDTELDNGEADRRPHCGSRAAWWVRQVQDFALRVGAIAVGGCGGNAPPPDGGIGRASAAARFITFPCGERLHAGLWSTRAHKCVISATMLPSLPSSMRAHECHVHTCPLGGPRAIRFTRTPERSKVYLLQLDEKVAGGVGTSPPLRRRAPRRSAGLPRVLDRATHSGATLAEL